MSDPRVLPEGKLAPQLLRELLPDAGDHPAEILVPPQVGEDGCVISVPGGALVVATDPITLVGSGVGAHAVWINANDVAVMGARPRWFLANVLLPRGTTEEQVREIFDGMRRELARIDALLVGGHTEVTAAVRQPVVVGQMLGLREDGGYVRTGGMSAGDVLVQVGATPIEGAAVLAAQISPVLVDRVDPAQLALARRALEQPGISIVASALLATELHASSLHDPTEGGIAGALYEMAEASSCRLRIDEEAVLWFAPGIALCEAFDADPWGTLASGTLLASFPAERAEHAIGKLREAGQPVAQIGEVLESVSDAPSVVTSAEDPLPRFDRDEISRVGESKE